MLIELYDLDRQLCEAAAELDYRLTDGTDWAGWAIWPNQLAPRLWQLHRITFELDGMRARVRAQWAEGSIERLRDDIEQLVSSLRRATDLYTRRTIDVYRASDGKPLGRSATGRGPTVLLPDVGVREKVGELRQTARILFRSSAYQLDLKDMAEREDMALWPFARARSLGATRTVLQNVARYHRRSYVGLTVALQLREHFCQGGPECPGHPVKAPATGRYARASSVRTSSAQPRAALVAGKPTVVRARMIACRISASDTPMPRSLRTWDRTAPRTPPRPQSLA